MAGWRCRGRGRGWRRAQGRILGRRNHAKAKKESTEAASEKRAGKERAGADAPVDIPMVMGESLGGPVGTEAEGTVFGIEIFDCPVCGGAVLEGQAHCESCSARLEWN